ncbi:hypothetical protein HDU76_013848 [Blyttiomyces sp. JEL0837]|nr:hypothetical protein HDU76_013848 [Blyttiomyces sp. JEL0837]
MHSPTILSKLARIWRKDKDTPEKSAHSQLMGVHSKIESNEPSSSPLLTNRMLLNENDLKEDTIPNDSFSTKIFATLHRMQPKELYLKQTKATALKIIDQSCLFIPSSNRRVEIASAIRALIINEESLVTVFNATLLKVVACGELAQHMVTPILSELSYWSFNFALTTQREPATMVDHQQWKSLARIVELLTTDIKSLSNKNYKMAIHTRKILENLKAKTVAYCAWRRIPIKLLMNRTQNRKERDSLKAVMDIISDIVGDKSSYSIFNNHLETSNSKPRYIRDLLTGKRAAITTFFDKLLLSNRHPPVFFVMELFQSTRVMNIVQMNLGLPVIVAMFDNMMIICTEANKSLLAPPFLYKDCAMEVTPQLGYGKLKSYFQFELQAQSQSDQSAFFWSWNNKDTPDFTNERKEPQFNEELVDCGIVHVDGEFEEEEIRSSEIAEGFRESFEKTSETIAVLRRTKDDARVICKSITPAITANSNQNGIPIEIEVLRKLRDSPHRAFIKYLDHYELAEYDYRLIMQCLGDDWVTLFEFINELGREETEGQLKFIFRQCVEAVKFLRDRGYYHNDINDQNFLINKTTRQVKLIDFHSCTHVEPNHSTSLPSKFFPGPSSYKSPEVLKKETYDPACHQVWCLGVLWFFLMFKEHPFYNDDEIMLTRIGEIVGRIAIKNRRYSVEAERLLLKLMAFNPKRRVKIDRILKLSMFVEGDDDE